MTAAGTLAAALAGAMGLVVIGGWPSGASALSFLALATAACLLLAFLSQGAAVRARVFAWLVLAVLLLGALVQLHARGGRLGGDGVSYYVYVRSLVKDGDLDFTNEYTHYELIDREDIRIPTRTGRRRSIFAVGPGLAWVPFFLLGEGVAHAQSAFGLSPDASGYGPLHVNAVALGSLLFGFGALLLMHDMLRRHFREATALLAVLLVWGATFLHWYMVHQPSMSHAPSAFGATLVVWLWERGRANRRPLGWTGLGLALGFAMCLRWQNGVLLVLPAWDLVRRARGAALTRAALSAMARDSLLLAAGALAGAFPQMAAWKLIYGDWLLRYPPHGADFVRLDHPFVLQTLFSSRHGLLAWTPALWVAYLGFLPLLRWRPEVARPLLVPLLLMTYVNMCSGDWWAGGSFSNRRFDSLLPVFAFGFAAGLDALARAVAAHPGGAVAMFFAPFLLWNTATLAAVWRGAVRTDTTVAFPRLVGAAARAVSDTVGSPTTWPASWIFAAREGRPPGQYDRLVGRYLFYRQNNMGGRILVAHADDEAHLAEGWGAAAERGGRRGRWLHGQARVLAPLDDPEDLRLTLVAAAASSPAVVAVSVNGHPVGRIAVGAAGATGEVEAPRALWHRELNDVTLVAEGGPVLVEEMVFVRPGSPDPPRGARRR